MDRSIRLESIMRILNNRRYETSENLSLELGVSKRTIQRDITLLSRYKPIYTQSGKHGGVFIVDGYTQGKPSLNTMERAIMLRVLDYIKINSKKEFEIYEIEVLESIVASLSYTK